MSQTGVKRIAIVGGGASGALVATALLGRMKAGDEITIFDPAAQIGRGAAYGTTDPSHLLNVRAGKISAFPDDPDHFTRWLSANGLPSQESSFAARRDFGTYLSQTLDKAQQDSPAKLVTVRERAIRLESPLKVIAESGCSNAADAVVLATGNLPPSCPASLAGIQSHPRYLGRTWDPTAFEAIDPDDTVFMVGTGLTMIDAFLTLANRGHRGQVIARSRHGLLPRPHRLEAPLPTTLCDFDRAQVFRSVMRRLKGENWRAAMDGMQPYTDALWSSTSVAQRRRFMKKLRPYWEVHRHRVPESVAKILEEAQADGRLIVGCGPISSVEESGEGFYISLGELRERADWIVNCTGPKGDIRSEKVPILESAVSGGFAAYDPMGMGLVVDEDGRTEPEGRVWAIGPLCRGSRWETTAIPEIRVQAVRIAELLS